ncbi:thiamine pyrophosphate-dependent enzyme, partial [Citrobacter freundii]|uniref:thiamine pyrophosphate-dependent enzyme n=1 Tax=Citrobacter freundii TaxID=546 RepID=UPI001EF84D2B
SLKSAAVFFGDGACDAGVFWESVNAAALFKLPVLFVCEDNGYAVDTPREARQMSKSLSDAVKPFGADTYDDDSGDVESVYALAKE